MENRKLLTFFSRHKILSFISILMIFLIILFYVEGHQWVLFCNRSIKGQIIDVETKKPIEGAMIVSMWRLEQIPGQGFGGYAKVSVVTSGADGKFKIPFWVRFKPWKLATVMADLAPEITIYKPGYKVYWSHQKLREGMKEEWNLYTSKQMEEIKEANSLDPVKLKRIYTNEERADNLHEIENAGRLYDVIESVSINDSLKLIELIKQEYLLLSREHKKRYMYIEQIDKRLRGGGK